MTADGATPLRYFPKAPIKKEYVVVPRTILADEPRLKPWAEAAIAYAAGAYPAK